MRLGLYANRLTRPTTTGVGVYIAGLSAALAELRAAHELVLFSVPERQAVPAGTYGRMPIGYLPWPRAAVHVSWCLLGRPKVNRLDGPLDLVHVLVPGVPVPTDLPLVVTVHDLMPIKFPRFFDARTCWLVRRTIGQIGREASRIIAVSERTRRDLCDLLQVPEERVAVVHLGVPSDIRRPSPPALQRTLERYGLDGVVYVLFVGVVTDRKNPLGLVDAFSLIAARLPAARLVLVGSSGLGTESVSRRIRALGLDRRVRLLGHVDRVDLPALLSGAAVFVLPSIYEGFGIPVLEAMACGTPVVVSDGGSLPEVVGQAGLVVPDAEATELAAAILRVIQDEPTRERLSRLGLARAEEFTWQTAARRTLAVYEDALQA